MRPQVGNQYQAIQIMQFGRVSISKYNGETYTAEARPDTSTTKQLLCTTEMSTLRMM